MLKLSSFLLLCLFVLFPLGQLERILPGPLVGLYLHDIVIFLLFIAILIRRKKFKLDKIFLAFCYFLIWAMVSFVANLYGKGLMEIVVGLAYLVRLGMYSSIYFILEDYPGIKKLFSLSLFAACILGWAQYLLLPDIYFLSVFGWDPHFGRVVGTYLDPAFAGLVFLSLLVILVFAKPRLWIKIAIVFCALFLTWSRSTWVAYVVSAILAGWLTKSVRFSLVALTVFLLALFVLPQPEGEGGKIERQYSIWSRLQSWQTAGKIFVANPAFGSGFGFYRLGSQQSLSRAGAGADNSFLFVLASTGLPGLVLFLHFIWRTLRLLYLKKEYWALIIVSAILIHSLFNNSFFYPFVMIIFWVVVAKGYKKS